MKQPPANFIYLLEACTREQDNNIFSLRDPGTHSRAVVHVKSRKCQKIQIDGALTAIQPLKCDWCIRDKESGECLFVELKGSDCLHAAKQIINTLKWFQANIAPFKRYSPAYIVAHARIPRIGSKDQLAIATVAQQVGIALRCVHSPADLNF